MRKRDALRGKELMEAFANSERSFEEVIRFLKSLGEVAVKIPLWFSWRHCTKNTGYKEERELIC